MDEGAILPVGRMENNYRVSWGLRTHCDRDMSQNSFGFPITISLYTGSDTIVVLGVSRN